MDKKELIESLEESNELFDYINDNLRDNFNEFDLISDGYIEISEAFLSEIEEIRVEELSCEDYGMCNFEIVVEASLELVSENEGEGIPFFHWEFMIRGSVDMDNGEIEFFSIGDY